MADETATLERLSDTDLTVAQPSQDVRGRKVVDRAGEDLGEVDDLLIDGEEKRVRFLHVASGGFLGLGESKSMIPVDAISSIDEDKVHLDKTREDVAKAPPYDPELTIDAGYWNGVYGYYGYAPFWSPGYVYPGYLYPAF
jgi:sporulation protein YlmC with PRC-barrel domain